MGSYLELEELALLGDNFGKLLNNAVKDYEEISGNMSKVRANILREFNPIANAKQWDLFWEQVAKY